MNNGLTKERAQELFENYSEQVFRTAYLLTRSRTLADDVTQETFLRLFRNYRAYDASRPFEPWLYRLTVNTARNLLRKHKWLTFIGATPERAGTETPESEVVRGEDQQELWREIDRLPLKGREVIVLHFYAGLKLAEIAETLDIPLGTCKSRLHTALTSLRKRLQGGHSLYFAGGESYDVN